MYNRMTQNTTYGRFENFCIPFFIVEKKEKIIFFFKEPLGYSSEYSLVNWLEFRKQEFVYYKLYKLGSIMEGFVEHILIFYFILLFFSILFIFIDLFTFHTEERDTRILKVAVCDFLCYCIERISGLKCCKLF